VSCSWLVIRLNLSASTPTSSCESTSARLVSSPAAIFSAVRASVVSGRAMLRARNSDAPTALSKTIAATARNCSVMLAMIAFWSRTPSSSRACVSTEVSRSSWRARRRSA
jgi:hypothetical protein